MSKLTVTAKNEFDLEVVRTGFQKSRQLDESILIDEYLVAFKELCRFFRLVGRLFAFVATDLEAKIAVLENLRSGPSRHKYETVQSMVKYEVETNTADSGKRNPSGCRTLLRLQRALEFILKFMHEINISEADARISTLATDVYHETLAKHHPWFVRKMAVFVVLILPSKKDLIQIMCKQEYDDVHVLLKEVVDAGNPVYRTVYRLYEDNGLLQLA